MLLSILCLSYNHEKFIHQCLESAWRQNVKDMEIIALDDGSSDNSGSLLEQMAKESSVPMKAIRQENSGNIGGNFNTLLQHSSGKYVSMMSCDDIIADNSLGPKIDIMERDKNVVAAWSEKREIIDSDGKITGEVMAPSALRNLGIAGPSELTGAQMYEAEYEYLHTFSMQGNVIRKSMIDAIGGFDEDLIGDDVVLRAKIELYMMKHPNLKCAVLPGAGVLYRVHDNNLHINIARLVKLHVQVLERYFPDRPLPEALKRMAQRGIQILPFNHALKMLTLSKKMQAWMDDGDFISTILKTARREENLDYLLTRHGRLAFWGLGSYFRHNVPAWLSDRPGIFLVDKVNRDFFGCQQGQSSDVLKSEKVDLIIISVAPNSDPYRAISRDIAAEYPDAAVMPLEQLLCYPLLWDLPARLPGGLKSGMRKSRQELHRQPSIEVLTMWYNEAYLAPFFLKHYAYADRITLLYDADTADNTLEIVKSYPNVRVMPFHFPDMMDDELKRDMLNARYKETQCDWVLSVDADEFVFYQRGLDFCYDLHPVLNENPEYDLFSVMLYQIYRHRDDADLDQGMYPVPQRRHGDPNVSEGINALYNKPILVRKGLNMSWSPGCHTIEVMAGKNLSGSPVSLMGAHWAMADPAFAVERRVKNRRERQSKNNLAKGLTLQHHNVTIESIMCEFEQHKNDPQLF
jgi:alpha-1,3-rhamnosyltransferase